MNAGNCLSRFNSIFKENDEIYRNAAKMVGLSDCTFWILYALRESGELLTQSDICYGACLPKQTVNSALKKLETDGYIELLNMTNRRSKQIRLTPKGVKLSQRTVDKVMRLEQDALSGLTSREQETFLLLFQKFTDLLKDNIQTLEKQIPQKQTSKKQTSQEQNSKKQTPQEQNSKTDTKRQ